MCTRTLLVLVLAVFFLCLAPLLYIGRYDVPGADDYYYGIAAHLAFVHGGSVSDIAAAVAAQVAESWHIWQGSWSAIALMCLQPAVFSESLYRLTPWLMFASLFGGLFTLCADLFSRVFGLPRRVGLITAGMLGILYLLLVPGPVESFFWFNGSVYYTFYHGLAMLAAALAIRTAQEGGSVRASGLSLLALFLGGGNLITGLSLVILALSVLPLLLLIRRPREARRLLLPVLMLLLGFALNVLAPGNAVRASNFEHSPAVIPAVLASFRAAGSYLLRWLRLPTLGVLLSLGLLFWAVLPGAAFSFRCPLAVTAWSVCFFTAMFCPTMYAMGTFNGQRQLAILFYAFLLLTALNLLYWLGWLRQRFTPGATARDPALLSTLGSLALCVVLLAVSAQLKGGVSLASAYTALTTGQAEVYYRIAQERLEILKDPAIRVAELEPYRDPPYLLFFDDLAEEADDWRNLAVSDFYEKDRVVLRRGDNTE